MAGTFKIRDLNPSPAPRGGPIKKVSIRCSSLGQDLPADTSTMAVRPLEADILIDTIAI